MTADGTREKLEQDAGAAPWRDLLPHLRRDAVILVAADLDLVEAALAVANDDKDRVSDWLQQGLLSKPSPEQVEQWQDSLDQQFRTVVVQPFVLAQQTQ